jgi:hypothetical protein
VEQVQQIIGEFLVAHKQELTQVHAETTAVVVQVVAVQTP